MNCRKVQSFLSAYCDGSLPSDRSASVDKHLRICKTCEREILFMRQMRAAAETLPRMTLAEDFNLKLMNRIYAEQNHPTESYLPVEQPSLLRRPIGWATAAVTVCLSIFVTLSVMNWNSKVSEGGFDQATLNQNEIDGSLASTTVTRREDASIYDYVLGVAGDRSNYRATNVSQTRTLHVADDKVESLYVEMQKRLRRMTPNYYQDFVNASYTRQNSFYPYKQARGRSSLLHQASSSGN